MRIVKKHRLVAALATIVIVITAAAVLSRAMQRSADAEESKVTPPEDLDALE